MQQFTLHTPFPRPLRIGSFGIDSDSILLIPLLIVGCFGSVAVLLFSYGSLLAAFAFALMLAVLIVTLYRVEYGFYVFLAAVLACDQHVIPGFLSVTLKPGYFLNLKEIPYLPSFAAGVVNPLELHLFLLIFVWFLIMAVKRQIHAQAIPAWGTAVLLFLWLVISLVNGLRSGGEALPALWEVRALAYFFILYFFVPQIINTKEQVQAVMWVCIAAITFKALQGLWRFMRLGFTTGGFPTLTNHEDPLFIATLVIFLFALVLFNAPTSQRWTLVFLLFPLLMGFYVAQRRAAYAAVILMLPTFVALLPNKERWLLLKSSLPIVLVAGLYVAIFWESESRLAAPLRLVKTGLSSDKEEAGERYYSNLYRDLEEYNLAVTVRNAPVMGIGFGRKYEEPLKLVDIMFPLRDFIPHNEVLWVVVKTGAIGFFLLWLFFNSFAWRAVSTIARLRDPYLKAVCAVAVCAIIGQIVVSYYDLQLTYYRNMVYLGTIMGLLPACISADSAAPSVASPNDKVQG